MKLYPIIGGPLDGRYANRESWYKDGELTARIREYLDYNSAGHGKPAPTMIWLHKSLLRPTETERTAKGN